MNESSFFTKGLFKEQFLCRTQKKKMKRQEERAWRVVVGGRNDSWYTGDLLMATFSRQLDPRALFNSFFFKPRPRITLIFLMFFIIISPAGDL